MGRVAAGVRVRGGADDDGLVDLHDRSLYGIGERACGGGPHVHHHAALSRLNLFRAMGAAEGKGGGGEGNK